MQELFAKFPPDGKLSIPQKEGCTIAHFTWTANCDDKSTVNIPSTKEEINGKIEERVTFFGDLSNNAGKHGFAGAIGHPNVSTRKALQKMKSLSFKALGDGNEYFVKLRTTDDKEGCHFIYYFPTIKDEIISETISIPDDLIIEVWSDTEAEFIQKNIIFLEFHKHQPGQFYLKFWDIRLYQ